MKRWSVLLVLAAAWPLLTAGGGMTPPPVGSTRLVGPPVTATVVIDTHDPFNAPLRATDGYASLRVRRGYMRAGSTFNVGFTNFSLGCELSTAGTPFEAQGPSLTDVRFKGRLWWVPWTVQQDLFAALGVDIGPESAPLMTPEITYIAKPVCTPDDTDGVLSFDAIIHFRVAQF
jgi:hypothetical protein